jgi:endoglucanase
MKNIKRYGFLGLVLMAVFFASCKKDVVIPKLSVSPNELLFTVEGGVYEVTINSNTDWKIVSYNAPDWLQLSQTTGGKGSTVIKITALANTGFTERSVTLLVSTTIAEPYQIAVSQSSRSKSYPSYNTSPTPADATGMNSNAVQLAAKFKLGWNIGNTMEAIGGETAWGNPLITESYIKFVKQNGFSAIRIPCSWNQYAHQTTAKISDTWLNRVKEVVKYCVDNDMYILLNIHWDGGWLETDVTPEKKDSVNDKQKAFWEQIATKLRDFDEHLMFAAANEPTVDNVTKNDVLSLYNQTFVDAVRSTGGRNRYRVLVVQGNSELDVKMPTDPASGRLMYEEHNYTPYQFTLMNEDASWGKMFYYWGTDYHSTIEPDRNANWGEEDYMNTYFQRIKTKFTDNGIPVIMGEYGAYRRTTPLDMNKHQASIDHWITFVTKQAIANGLKPFWWDTGGALDRRTNTVLDQRTIDAIIAGSH